MKRRGRARLGALALVTAVGVASGPVAARAQGGTADAAAAKDAGATERDTLLPVGATLRGWAAELRLAIFDRGGSFDGRLSERGILQRIQASMDDEYDLDLLSSRFLLSEDYRWYRRTSGARYRAGSIDHRRLVQAAELKAEVGLGGAWAADVRFDHEETLTSRRNLVRIGFRRGVMGGRGEAFLSGTLKADKPEADLEGGFTWSPGRSELTVALGALDLFSDLIYQELVVDSAFADSTLDYRSHPFTGRVSLDLALSDRLRFEGHALALTPTRVAVEAQVDPGTGFVQDEDFAYAGGLIEWTPTRTAAFGALATWVRARLDRRRLAAGDPVEPFDLRERTWRFGLYGIGRWAERLIFEARLERIGRAEDRTTPASTGQPDLDYRDRTWAGRTDLIYETARGIRAGVGLDFWSRDTVGTPPVETLQPLGRDQSRLRVDLGYRAGRTGLFVVGINLDMDLGADFDGAHGRFRLFW